MKYVFFFIILFFAVSVPYIIYDDYKCEVRGGKPTRIGCVKPEIFLNE